MSATGNNHAYSGRYNRRLVFDLVRTKGETSRSELVALTGLQPQTISNITRELQDRGLLREESRPDGSRGAPQKILAINGAAGCSIGLHLDRDLLLGVACDLTAREITRSSTRLNWRDPNASVAGMAQLVSRLIAESGDNPAWGIGIAMPTLQEEDYEQYVGSPGWQEWSHVDVADALEAACALPVIVENDATAAAIAELQAGEAGELSHFVYVFIGHGLGAGIIIDGLPFQGAFNNAGEIGLLSWPEALKPAETGNATPFSLDEVAAMVGCDASTLEEPGTLERLYHGRDSGLMRWLELSSARLRLLAAMIENMFDPEAIFVGGSFPAVLLSSLVDRAYPLLASVAARKNREGARLRLAGLGASASAVGAAMLPIIAHGSPDFRRLSLMRGRKDAVDPETRFDRVAG
ncbi:ROK family transcriptional regulator [Martelella endophytica]|uniref:Transcriptional regulator n=1 Tax=Martelella endophytica TaxID=1486262 RepID=A0A0D5LNS6_MAREN|nr:ROK family transcriptional regulator [Martelella endophytica]AJY45412.1 transcriptional regulator [Martelella endophytica]